MSPITRRKSMRLAELADKEAESEKPTPKQPQQPIKRDSVISTVSGGRVTKPEPKARVVASRYLSAVNPRKPEPSSKAGTRPTPTPASLSMGARARAGSITSAASIGTASASRARAQIQFDDNKAAAAEELDRLSREAEHAKRLLVDERRKLKLMQEYSALSTWLAANKQTLVDMGAQVSRVREPYTKFSEQLKQTTRAMPISGVHFRDGESLVNDMQGFVDAVEHNFSTKSEEVRDVFRMASRMKQYYKGLAQEQDLVTECDRLKQSLEHTAVLAISSKLGDASDSC
ncbi:hypothetical protein H4S03_001501 [Coemansia sp. S3946]|nr:hypothetical protein H4S03_001501 [Coemansia sp. S3946]